ncbi:MAG TPA: hypothetical protein VGU44_00775 [Gammaproteobacteria bacterium]|nr:hypothetical protein [Gammaproteobacteria bacterium]
MQAISSHLLIRSTQLTQGEMGNEYEFILDNQLNVLKWVKLKTDRPRVFYPRDNANMALEGMLFELNHVRVNPMLDNTRMIAKLTDALTEIGVTICNQPHKTSMAICFKPMGEIRDNVRFYLNKEGKLVFLSPSTRPRLVYSKPKS